MVAFNTIKSGDTLWDCRKQKQGNTTTSRMACWTVNIIEVDKEGGRVLASWNGNPARWMYERSVSKLRRTPVKGR